MLYRKLPLEICPGKFASKILRESVCRTKTKTKTVSLKAKCALQAQSRELKREGQEAALFVRTSAAGLFRDENERGGRVKLTSGQRPPRELSLAGTAGPQGPRLDGAAGRAAWLFRGFILGSRSKTGETFSSQVTPVAISGAFVWGGGPREVRPPLSSAVLLRNRSVFFCLGFIRKRGFWAAPTEGQTRSC